MQRASIDATNREYPDTALTLDERQNRRELLIARSRTGHGQLLAVCCVRWANATTATDVRFVNLDRSRQLLAVLERLRSHRVAEPMIHEPRGAVGDSNHPVQLVSGETLLAGANEMQGEKPLGDRHMR